MADGKNPPLVGRFQWPFHNRLWLVPDFCVVAKSHSEKSFGTSTKTPYAPITPLLDIRQCLSIDTCGPLGFLASEII